MDQPEQQPTEQTEQQLAEELAQRQAALDAEAQAAEAAADEQPPQDEGQDAPAEEQPAEAPQEGAGGEIDPATGVRYADMAPPERPEGAPPLPGGGSSRIANPIGKIAQRTGRGTPREEAPAPEEAEGQGSDEEPGEQS